jgi:hypothetical protein
MKRRCSCHPLSAFHWRDPGYPTLIQWSDLNKSQVTSERSSEVVNAKRADGVDVAFIPGLSKRVLQIRIEPRLFHVFSKARTHGKN